MPKRRLSDAYISSMIDAQGRAEQSSGTSGAKLLPPSKYRYLAQCRYKIRQRFWVSGKAAFHVAGLSPEQHDALLFIKAANGELNLGELARQLGSKSNSASKILKGLEADGLVRRRRFNNDNRQWKIAVTAEGESVLAQLSFAHDQELALLAPVLRELLLLDDIIPEWSDRSGELFPLRYIEGER